METTELAKKGDKNTKHLANCAQLIKYKSYTLPNVVPVANAIKQTSQF